MLDDNVKNLILKPIRESVASKFICDNHYSGKCAVSPQINVGVFWRGSLCGAMQLGPSLDKRKLIGLVRDTRWNEFIELNRLAFTDALPKNSESRALSVLFRILKKDAPQIKWIVSFADATQCGDGTIYRASGFVLTGITKNANLFQLPDGRVVHKIALETTNTSNIRTELRQKTGLLFEGGTKVVRAAGGVPLKGFQLRYIYFQNKDDIKNLTVPIIPFSKITEMGIGMYRGKICARNIESDVTAIQP